VRGGAARRVGFGGVWEKYAREEGLGGSVFRVTPEMVADGNALAYIEGALKGTV
jgi:hypothetical protein